MMHLLVGDIARGLELLLTDLVYCDLALHFDAGSVPNV
jgi:hypothetical protein